MENLTIKHLRSQWGHEEPPTKFSVWPLLFSLSNSTTLSSKSLSVFCSIDAFQRPKFFRFPSFLSSNRILVLVSKVAGKRHKTEEKTVDVDPQTEENIMNPRLIIQTSSAFISTYITPSPPLFFSSYRNREI